MSDRIVDLQELQVRRKFYIKAKNRQGNAVASLARRACGFSTKLSEEEREAIKKRALRIMSSIKKDRPLSDDDSCIADAIRLDYKIAMEGMAPYERALVDVEKQMVRAAKALPAHKFQKEVRGFGELALAVIVGEAGDLSNYPTIEKLWKRLGLAPYNGKAGSTWRSPKLRNAPPLSDQEWTDLGYKPSRLAEVHEFVYTPFMRAQPADGRYRMAYDQRRAHTALTNPDWCKGHSHYDGMRIMSKVLISDLWSEWQRASTKMPETADLRLPAADIIADLAA